VASFNTDGFEQLENMLLTKANGAGEIAEEMLEAGSEILIKAHNAGIKRSLGRRTGTLEKSSGKSKIRKNDRGRFIPIYPQGEQPHGTPGKGQSGNVRNAQAGFTNEYGSSSIPPRPWMAPANAQAENEVREAMTRIWEEKHSG